MKSIKTQPARKADRNGEAPAAASNWWIEPAHAEPPPRGVDPEKCFDEEAERTLLGAIVVAPDRAGDWIKDLKASDFHFPAHRTIFDVFVDQWRRNRINPLVAGEISHAPGYLLELGEQFDPATRVSDAVGRIIRARQFRNYKKCDGKDGHVLDEAVALADLENFCRAARKPSANISTFADLFDQNQQLNPPVIEGIARQSETVNIIANSKFGKSWLLHYVLLCIVVGRKIFGRFSTIPGRCLLIDNELHPATLAHRIKAVADAMGLTPDDYKQQLDIWALRGRLPSLADIECQLRETIEPSSIQAIGWDAMYRFLPVSMSENDNAAMKEIYNAFDRIGDDIKATNLVVHHASKGDQSDKRVTDVGAGAGAQSRAADCHLILREHEQPGVAVLEAAVRSFAPVEPMALRWCFPLWLPDSGVDAGKLKGRQTQREQRQNDADREGMLNIVDALRKWDPAEDGPATANQLLPKTGMGKERQQRLLCKLEFDGQVLSQPVRVRGNQSREYSISKNPE